MRGFVGCETAFLSRCQEMGKAARVGVALVVLASLGGCSEEPWRTKSIAGMMPELAFDLVSAEGGRLTAEDLKGSAVLLAFGYASCPDVCPTTLARLTELEHRLPAEAARQVEVLFVSVDPQRDSPERLSAFTTHFGAGIVGATGTQTQLRALTRRYRTTYGYGSAGGGGFYEVAHSSGVYVFDRAGEPRLLFRPDDSMEAMQADLMRLLE